MEKVGASAENVRATVENVRASAEKARASAKKVRAVAEKGRARAQKGTPIAKTVGVVEQKVRTVEETRTVSALASSVSGTKRRFCRVTRTFSANEVRELRAIARDVSKKGRVVEARRSFCRIARRDAGPFGRAADPFGRAAGPFGRAGRFLRQAGISVDAVVPTSRRPRRKCGRGL